ncbi:MAG TPA: DUF1345 domain-containing protein [Acidimicrobiales bacterium]|nr:DUF1345 domain-containing protein [Acidimicrobiales bacterium]
MSKQRTAPGAPRAKARTQALLCAAIGACALGVAVAFAPWQAALAIGWDVTAVAWIGWTAVHVIPLGPDETRELAVAEDDSRATRDAMLVAASLTSLVGVVLVLLKAATERGAAHTLLTALACGTVVLSWATVHLLFTLRYARLYYDGGGGIDFHDHRRPDYGDFTYVAFTLGMTYQVSDTDLTGKRIRMTALRHALLSYLFGTAVIAVTINVVAGLLTK